MAKNGASEPAGGLIALGDELMEDQKFPEAIEKYQEALRDLDCAVPDLLAGTIGGRDNRHEQCTVLVRLAQAKCRNGSAEEAIKIATAALRLTHDATLKASLYFRLGEAYLQCDQSAEALDAFRHGKSLRGDLFKWNGYIQIAANMAGVEVSADEKSFVVPSTGREGGEKKHSEKRQRSDGKEGDTAASRPDNGNATTAVPYSPPLPPLPRSRPRYAWVQSGPKVEVTIYAKGLGEKDFEVNTERQSLMVTITASHLLDEERSEPWRYSFKLYDIIQPEKTSIIRTANKLEITLVKLNPSHSWDDLEAPLDIMAKRSCLGASSARDGPPPPPSSAPVKRDWNEIEKKLEEEMNGEPPEGDAALQQMFQKIFAQGDENTRRAMIKSFQTSGGTVLSTNWDEVSKTDYEKEAPCPEGQVRRKYDI